MDIAARLANLQSAQSFEAIARTLCAWSTSLGAARRSAVFLRGSAAYDGVFVEDQASKDLRPSTSLWRWARAGHAVWLDVQGSEVHQADGLGEPVRVNQADFRSRSCLLDRSLRWILALPLRSILGRPVGHLSLEFEEAGARERIPVADLQQLQLLADLATPFLERLPRRPHRVEPDPLLPVVGQSMATVVHDLKIFAKSDLTVLLTGDSGVGKSRLARWVHERSDRGGRFVRVNLATTAESLRAGTLFGWVKGSFTGAQADREGQVKLANGGTLFIDEIDKLPVSAQALLLDLLDDGTWQAIGDSTTQSADLRIMVGTNADLPSLARKGAFLEDLLFRISEVPIKVPALTERRDEIRGWAEYFIRNRALKDGVHASLAAGAGNLLEGTDWPGNLRGLASVIGRGYALAKAEGAEHLLIESRHVERALAYGVEGHQALLEALGDAANAFLNCGLELKHTRAFRGVVLNAATARFGEREAFIALGEAQRLKASNHRKLLRSEETYLDELRDALSRKPR